MKALIVAVGCLLSLSCFSVEKTLFDCVHTKQDSNVWAVKVKEIKKGSRQTYRLDIEHKKGDQFLTTSKSAHLNETYGGRILTFGTGNTRVKIDRAIPLSYEKFKAFARLADFEIHSHDWICKGEMFQDHQL